MTGAPSIGPARRAPGAVAAWAWAWVLVLALAAWCGTGCGPGRPAVVVYAAQDRVFAEPLLRDFGVRHGVEVRGVYDNEATKTTGLANRLLAESARPLADLWWSNEELRTRQLVRRGVLDPEWVAFGERQRVLVVASHAPLTLPPGFGLSALIQPDWRGRVAMAYPLFGTTATHLAVLRERWGASAWETWCRALQANRPFLVDGNSVVVRMVARGEAAVGLTDSDDVLAAQREGLPVRAVPLPPGDALAIPNTVALVRGAAHPEPARRLAEFLRSPESVDRMTAWGALDAGSSRPPGPEPGGIPWERILDSLDDTLRWLAGNFQR